MKLEHVVNWSILNYPTLYRCNDHQESRLLVLENLFCGIGTGYEWTKEGYLTDRTLSDPSKKCVEKLPDNFYQMKLYSMTSPKRHVSKVKSELKAHGRWFHCLEKNYLSEIDFVFEADEEFATLLFKKYPKRYTPEPDLVIVRQAKSRCVFNPYPLCRYSPLVEMINRRTDSTHIENFDLEHISEDWIQGAVEVAREVIAYYNDESRFTKHIYHPNNCLYMFEDRYKKDPEKYRRENEPWGMTPEMSVEDWCNYHWNKYVTKQEDYCKKLIEMYG